MPPSPEAELPTWVAHEAATLVDRLVGIRGQAAIRELEAVRKDFEAAALSIAAALATPLGADTEIVAFREQCSTRAALDVSRARTAEREAVVERSNQALAAARAELDAARTQLQAERDRADRACADAARVPDQHVALVAAQAELDTARAQLKAERDRADRACADAARLVNEFDGSVEELRMQHAAVIGQHAQSYPSLPLDQLLTVFASMRRAATSAEVLTSLVDGLARELPRVALFEVHGALLTGVEQRGFDVGPDIATASVSLSANSLLGRAVFSGRLEVYFADAHGESVCEMPFGGTPTCVLAIPIMTEGATTAVIYADDPDQSEFAPAAARARAKFADLLMQHAVLELVRISADQSALSELRDYAATLATEVEFAYTADADTSRNPFDRQRRLREDLDRARRVFAQRVGPDRPSAAGLFAAHLDKILDDRGETLFERDLAAVLGPSPVRSGSQPRVVSMFR
jgi:hypothetical protein